MKWGKVFHPEQLVPSEDSDLLALVAERHEVFCLTRANSRAVDIHHERAVGVVIVLQITSHEEYLRKDEVNPYFLVCFPHHSLFGAGFPPFFLSARELPIAGIATVAVFSWWLADTYDAPGGLRKQDCRPVFLPVIHQLPPIRISIVLSHKLIYTKVAVKSATLAVCSNEADYKEFCLLV